MSALEFIELFKCSVTFRAKKPYNELPSNWEFKEVVRTRCRKTQPFKITNASPATYVLSFEEQSKQTNFQTQVHDTPVSIAGIPFMIEVEVEETKSFEEIRQKWKDHFFTDEREFDDMLPGQRPDTVVLHDVPCNWFGIKNIEKINPVANEPNEILALLFQQFGTVTRWDCQAENQDTEQEVVRCDIYAQFETYDAFCKCMEYCHGKYLRRIGKPFVCNCAVSCDFSEMFEYTNLRKRRFERDQVVKYKEKQKQDQIRREAAEKRRQEEQKKLEEQKKKLEEQKRKAEAMEEAKRKEDERLEKEEEARIEAERLEKKKKEKEERRKRKEEARKKKEEEQKKKEEELKRLEEEERKREEEEERKRKEEEELQKQKALQEEQRLAEESLKKETLEKIAQLEDRKRKLVQEIETRKRQKIEKKLREQALEKLMKYKRYVPEQKGDDGYEYSESVIFSSEQLSEMLHESNSLDPMKPAGVSSVQRSGLANHAKPTGSTDKNNAMHIDSEIFSVPSTVHPSFPSSQQSSEDKPASMSDFPVISTSEESPNNSKSQSSDKSSASRSPGPSSSDKSESNSPSPSPNRRSESPESHKKKRVKKRPYRDFDYTSSEESDTPVEYALKSKRRSNKR